MRYDTFVAATHYVWGMQDAQTVDTWYEDGDMMYFKMRTGEHIMTYLIEYPLSVQNILHHLSTNTRNGISTIFIFWADMFLPADGDDYLMEDWMQAIASVQGDKLFGFEVAGRDAFFYPVYLQGQGRTRRVKQGDVIDFSQLHTYTIETNTTYLKGSWRIATFDVPDGTSVPPPYTEPLKVSPMAKYYAILGLHSTAPIEAVRRAYREMARQYHPDLNADLTAHHRMTQINEAYQRLIAYHETLK